MSLPDLAANHCVELVLRAEITVPPEVLTSLGRVYAKAKDSGRIIGDVEYGVPESRVHLLASISERKDGPPLLVIWIHAYGGAGGAAGTRRRGYAQARRQQEFEMALGRLGEVVSGDVSADLNATFSFPETDYSPAIPLPEIALPEGGRFKILGLRLGVGDADPATSIILDVGSQTTILVSPSLRVSARITGALLEFALGASSTIAERFVVRRG